MRNPHLFYLVTESRPDFLDEVSIIIINGFLFFGFFLVSQFAQVKCALADGLQCLTIEFSQVL